METTIKTGFTKSERLEIYRLAIKYIEDVVEEHGSYEMGFCAAIDEVISSLGYYSSDSDYSYDFINPFMNLEKTCPEVYKYKPNVNENRYYWFKVDKSGDKKRLSILREIVSELEQELNTNK